MALKAPLASAVVEDAVEGSADCPRSAERSQGPGQKWVAGDRVVAESAHASSAWLLFLEDGSYLTLQPKVRGSKSGQGEPPRRYSPGAHHMAHGRAVSRLS